MAHIAYIFASAHQWAEHDATNDFDMFRKDAAPGSLHEIGVLWAELRDKFLSCTADMATTSEDVGETLVHIAETYAAADSESAAAMIYTYADLDQKQNTSTTPSSPDVLPPPGPSIN